MNEKIPLFFIIGLALVLFMYRGNIERNYFSPYYMPRVAEIGYGTGFFVNETDIITNHHVIKYCSDYRIKRPDDKLSDLFLVAVDPYNDLAVLRTGYRNQTSALIQVNEDANKNDEVHIIGYPSNNYHYTKAQVIVPDQSILVGPPAFDKEFMQRNVIYTDSVRQGNSGGPLLSDQAHVLGVVDTYTILTSNPHNRSVREEGDLSKLKFGTAIHTTRLAQFLDENGVRYTTAEASSSTPVLSDSEVERIGNQFIVQVECIIDKTLER